MAKQDDFWDEIDEGWWESVLQDDESYTPAPRKPTLNTTLSEQLDWKHAQRIFLLDEIVEMRVVGFNRGGLLVDGNGLKGFVPYSHIVSWDVKQAQKERDAALQDVVGETLKLKVIECVPENGRVVFSERAAQAASGQRKMLFELLMPGQVVEGEVTNLTDFGAFVDLGGVEGLIHISEISWGRVKHPSALLHLGQKVRVQVLELSAERCRVALSLKRLHPNPWLDATRRHPPNSLCEAEITTLVSYGAFARLEDGIEGLIHVSQMPLAAGQRVNEFLHVGDHVRVRILQIQPEQQRLSLSMLLEPDKNE